MTINDLITNVPSEWHTAQIGIATADFNMTFNRAKRISLHQQDDGRMVVILHDRNFDKLPPPTEAT